MKLILIDDDRLVTGALKMILETQADFTVAACAEDGADALSLYRKHLPDVLLMDIRMRTVSGLDAARQILDEFPDARILLLTTFSDDEYIVKALRLGAKGYLLKQNYQNIIPAIRAVYSGQTVFGDEIVSKLPSLLGSQPDPSDSKDAPRILEQDYGLTSREVDVLRLIADGMNNKEIASLLFLSEGTVRNYLSSILGKLGLRDRTQAAVFYYKVQEGGADHK